MDEVVYSERGRKKSGKRGVCVGGRGGGGGERERETERESEMKNILTNIHHTLHTYVHVIKPVYIYDCCDICSLLVYSH